VPKQPTRTYRLFSGFGGSAFNLQGEFGLSSGGSYLWSETAVTDISRHLAKFLRDKPDIHDLSWSTDDGRTFVVKRKTSDISEVLGDTTNAI
jgi:hypothetical protein